MENPNNQMAATVPISATGIATLGISVARKLPINTQIVEITTEIDSTSVIST